MSVFNVSRNRFPLVGIYKETKNKSKKRSTNQVHTKSKGLSRHPTATTSVLPRLSLGSFVEKISAACPTCNISQQVSDLTLTIGQEEQQSTKSCLVATAELHQIIVEYWSWRLEQAPEFARCVRSQVWRSLVVVFAGRYRTARWTVQSLFGTIESDKRTEALERRSTQLETDKSETTSNVLIIIIYWPFDMFVPHSCGHLEYIYQVLMTECTWDWSLSSV